MRCSIFRSRSIRGKLALIIIAAMLPVFPLVMRGALDERRAVMAQAASQALGLAVGLSDQGIAHIESVTKVVWSLWRLSESRGGSVGERQRSLVDAWATSQIDGAFAVVGPDGAVIAATRDLVIGANLSADEGFRRCLALGRDVVTSRSSNPITGEPGIVVWMPISSDDVVRGSAVVVTMYPHWLESVVLAMNIPDGFHLALWDDGGRLLTSYPEEPSDGSLDESKHAGSGLADAVHDAWADEGASTTKGSDGVRRLTAYRRIRDGLGKPVAFLTVGVPVDKIQRASRSTMISQYIVMVITCTIVFAVVWKAADFGIVQPVNGLAAAAGRLSHGDLAARYGGPAVGNELGLLAQAFNHMAEALENGANKLTFLSCHDSLTGLYNRTYLQKRLAEMDSKDSLPMSVVVGDMNGLKLVNDALGHAQGDRLIVKAAEILRSVCRDEDIMVRWGGDEFVIIMPQVDRTSALDRCDRIRAACAQADPDPVPVSIALGVATRMAMSQDVGDVLNSAETRMRRSKFMESNSVRGTLIYSLRKALSESTHETEEHSARLQKLAWELGRAIGLPDDRLDDLALLCVLHDIGKVGIPDDILVKPASLTPPEWEIMRKHPEIGARIVEGSYELAHIADSIRAHHERWDGSGYPKGLAGEAIPMAARILSVIDAYDVMVHERPYKRALAKEEAMQEIQRCAGAQFDPLIAELFLEVMKGLD
ncbi:MAG: diguanylate cyclase [Clostridia bacterium]|nr:diguanylate cyclase [Clostridia bacterium]